MNYFSKQGRGTPCVRSRLDLRKKVLVLSLLLMASGVSVSSYAQGNVRTPATSTKQNVVSGIVKDKTGQTVIGATVKVKGTQTGSITDLNGGFRLPSVTTKSTLVVSYVGYNTQEVVAEPGASLVIILDAKDSKLDEVVVVGYGTQKKLSVTGSVVSVTAKELLKSPVVNASQALVGRVSGLMTRQTSGQPGNDDVTIRVRGRGTYGTSSALVLVDGIERSFNQLDMNEIETMTVLKDAASTAVYGVRGANGVILVTTKKGVEGPAKVAYTGSFAIQTPTRLPDFANSYDYAMLWNEGMKNDNPALTDDKLMFSKTDLQKYKDGSDPLYHPDINWYNAVMKDYSTQQQHNVNVSGGSQFARYYVSLGFLEQDGLYKNFNEQYGYSNNDNYKRFNLRTNVDVNLTKTTEMNFNIGTRTGIKNRGSDGFYGSLVGMAPYLTPGTWDNKIIYLAGKYARNPIQAMSTGFSKYTENAVETSFGINQKLDFVTKGLSARAKYSYDTNYRYAISRSRTPAVYTPYQKPVNGDTTTVYELYNATDESVGGVSGTSYDTRKIRDYLEAAVSYERSFGKHNVTGLFLYNQSKLRFHGYELPGIPVGYTGIVGRATYNFDSRYLIEFNLGHNGSENFPEGSRFGWFPAFSAGWVLSREKFFTRMVSSDLVSHLKLRASYGEVGNDDMAGRRFLYLPTSYATSSTATYFGEDFKTLGGMNEQKLGNPEITWEKAKKQNYALELKMFADKLSVNVDYFFEKRNDILASNGTIPALFAATPESRNLGIVENQGVDIELGWNQTINKFNYYIKGNYSFARNKVLYKAEAIDVINPYLAATGRRMDQPFGYQFVGFFKDAEDVASWPVQFSGASTPGDCKYADINGDGKVDTNDRIPMGYPTYPEISFGLNGGFSYKGFDGSFLFAGAANVSVNLDGIIQQPMLIGGQMLASVKDERWTPQTAETATRPKLTVAYSTNSNYLASTLWNRDASYVRLKNVEFGYRFNGRQLKKVGLSSMRIFVSGQNLITWDKLKIVDPENGQTGGLNYPQLKTYNLGLNFQF